MCHMPLVPQPQRQLVLYNVQCRYYDSQLSVVLALGSTAFSSGLYCSG